MDEATALKVLQNYGAPMTPQNLMRVMQQTGPTNAILAKSMGLQGAVDESGSTLDKLAFDSQRSPSGAAASTEPNVAPVVADAAPIAVAKAPVVTAATPTPPNVGRSGSSASTEPDVVPAASATQAGYTAPSIWQWLLPALGITSAAGTRAMAPAVTSTKAPLRMIGNDGQPLQVEGPDPNAKRLTYQPKIEGPIIPPGGSPPDSTAIDKLMTETNRGTIPTESSRPVNTNTDERNSEPVNKPTNLESKAPVTGPYDGEPTNLVEEIAKTIRKLKGVRK